MYSEIISESSRNTSHSSDEHFLTDVYPIEARPLPPIPLDTDENSKDKSSSVINLNDMEIFAKISSNKFKITECEPELAYKLFLVMVIHYAPDRKNDADIILKELYDRYRKYVDIKIDKKISNKTLRNTDSSYYQNSSVFFCQDCNTTGTAPAKKNESISIKTEDVDTTSEHLYMPMQPIYMVMQPPSSEEIQNIRGRANTI